MIGRWLLMRKERHQTVWLVTESIHSQQLTQFRNEGWILKGRIM
jgi:hypothetical protein